MASLKHGQREMIKSLIREELTRSSGEPTPPEAEKRSSRMSVDVAPPSHPPPHMMNAKPASPPAVQVSERSENTAAAAPSYTPLKGGDLITLRVSGAEMKGGWVLGSMAERTLAVESEAASSTGGSSGGGESSRGAAAAPAEGFGGGDGSGGGAVQATQRIDDGVFRICSKLNYRCLTELNKIHKRVQQSSDPEETKKALGLDQAVLRAKNEAAQNEESMGKLRNGAGFNVKFGDVVQLEHLKSSLFIAMHKTPAPVNSHCRKVSLKPGSFSAHYRILPRFKVRSIGSLVYGNDDVVFQSVKFEPMVLRGSGAPKDKLIAPFVDGGGSSSSSSSSFHRLPASLRSGPRFEVNGAMELNSFTLKIYARLNGGAEEGGGNRGQGSQSHTNLSTGLDMFRFYHPEGNAFVVASGDADKGQVLDAKHPSKRTRTRTIVGSDTSNIISGGGVLPVPAHIPYLKNVSGEVSNPANFSAKAVWRFESLDRTSSSPVKWRVPLRLKHVPSNKYLSVDSLNPTIKMAKQSVVRSKSSSSNLSSSGTDEGAGAGAVAGVEDAKDESLSRAVSSNAVLCNASLVFDTDDRVQEGALGSPSSLIFYLIPTDATSSDTLKNGVSALRLEHRSAKGQTLHLMASHEPKPLLTALSTTDDDNGSGGSSGSSESPSVIAVEALALDKKGGRLVFSSSPSAIDVLKLMPLTAVDGKQVHSLCSRTRLFRLYANRYQSFDAEKGEQPPIELCEAVVAQCLALIDELHKGDPPPSPRHATLADAMKEANNTLPAVFSTFFTGEPHFRMQRFAMEVKLLDAVFDAALAPYNRALNDARPFQQQVSSDQPRALAKFLYVTIQCALAGSNAAQEYFAGRSSRAWFAPPSPSASNAGAAASSSSSSSSASVAPPLAPAVRKWVLWRDIIISQAEDSLGAAVTLGQLLAQSENVAAKLVSNDLMDRFKGLIKRCGPEPRLINLFASICTVSGKPNPANQEMCLRTLWMNLPDRYSMGLTFHECDDVKVPKFGSMTMPSGAIVSPPPVSRAGASAPAEYLGKTKKNVYGPVCVAWTGADDWVGDSGKLFWSAKAMGIPVVGSLDTGKPEQPPKGGAGQLDLVPIECLMWALEPERLCEPVTGVQWVPIEDAKMSGRSKTLERKSTRTAVGSIDLDSSNMDFSEKQRADTHRSQAQLASYVVAEVNLLARMCKGRSYNCISMLEKSFSYDCLLNMAFNPLLPFVFRAAVIDFAQALFVNRFPQTVNSGAPCLPEVLWVFDEKPYEGPRKSSTAVVQPLTLNTEAAFPYFFVSPLSRVASDPNPVLSFPTHFKFFLLRSLTNGIISSFGESGRVVHSLKAFNDLGGAALRGQQGLLDFGFQSTYVKLKDLCEANAKLLDGRSDLAKPRTLFEPPEQRYRWSGDSVTKMKCEVIQLFLDVADLRANFRLAKLMHLFKTHAVRSDGANYLLGRKDADSKRLYDDFEEMFPGGSGDAAKLDLAVLGNKPDMDQALVDCLMYEDDNLMEMSLSLLDNTYGQRRKLRQALQDAMLLPSVEISCFGSVHALKICLNDLLFQTRTASKWGVASKIAGPFEDKTFNAIMANIDKVLTFLHSVPFVTASEGDSSEQNGVGGSGTKKRWMSFNTPEKVEASEALLGNDSKSTSLDLDNDENSNVEMKGVRSMNGGTTNEGTSLDDEELTNYQGYFKETDLQGNTYECKKLWSLDVASKWSNNGGGGRGGDARGKASGSCQEHHQEILRACNLQNVLASAIAMDHEIAWKGSICTLREKEESERRLTLVKRALLCLATAFVSCNKKNQEAVFGHLSTLQHLATPGADTVNKGLDERSPASSSAAAAAAATAAGAGAAGKSSRPAPAGAAGPGSRLTARLTASKAKHGNNTAGAAVGGKEAWPFTVQELSQELIMHILRRNEALCGRVLQVNMPLIELFATIVDTSSDVSVAPTLDLLFTLAQPEDFPFRENQTTLAGMLLNHSAFPNLAKAVASVVSVGSASLANPARLVQLVYYSMQNKNEGVASQMMQRANITIDATCTALIGLADQAEEFVDFASEKTTKNTNNGMGALSPGGGGLLSTDDAAASASAGLATDLGKTLLTLLAEQLYLLPMDAGQVSSEPLWRFLEGVAAPALEAFSSAPSLSRGELGLCEEVLDVFERVFSVQQRLGLFENLFSDPKKLMLIENVKEDIAFLLDSKALTPDSLKMAFVDATVRDGNNKAGLTRDAFKQLVLELDEKQGRRPRQSLSRSGSASGSGVSTTLGSKDSLLGSSSSGTSKKTPAAVSATVKALAAMPTDRAAQLEQAFDAADKDGSKMVDMEEFVTLFKSVGGDTLSKRTIECGERIRTIANGELPRRKALFARSDKYKQSERTNSSGKKQPKLFALSNGSVVGGTRSRPRGVKGWVPPSQTLAQRFEAFKGTVMENTRIIGALQRRRFSLIQVLEKGAPPPPTKALTFHHKDSGQEVENPLCSAVALGWSDLTSRFVSYCMEHFYDEGTGARKTVLLILEMWMVHLVKARTVALEEDGVTPAESIAKAASLRQVSPSQLSDELLAAYRAKQSVLNSLGVTELLARIISNLDDISPGAPPEVALEVFIELFNGGCLEAADSLYEYLCSVDTEGKLMEHLDRRLDLGIEQIREGKNKGAFGADNDRNDNGGDDNEDGALSSVSPDTAATCEYLITTMRFMQLLCEGHNLKFQNFLRVQPMYANSFDLVKKVVDILVMLCDSSLAVRRLHIEELVVVSQLLSLLIELMQGPCPGNQLLISESDASVALNNIIPALNVHDRERSLEDPGHMEIRGQACILLAACVEGREDFDCHKFLIKTIEVNALFGYQDQVEAEIRKTRFGALGRLFHEAEEQKLAVWEAALVAVVTVQMELRQEKREERREKLEHNEDGDGGGGDEGNNNEGSESDGNAADSLSFQKAKRNVNAAKFESEALYGIVEVAWKGQVERNVFAMPIEVDYLSLSTKAKFLEEVDLSTTEKRMSEMMAMSDAFIAEMRLIYDKAEQSPVFRALHYRMPTFKIYLYGLVLLLNMNVVFSPNKLESPARAIGSYMSGDLKLNALQLVGLTITVALFLLVLSGYAVIVAHLGTTEVPTLVRQLEDEWAGVDKDGNGVVDMGAWATFAAAFCVSVVFVAMHFINFSPVPGWYLAVALLMVPLSLQCLRAAIVRPTSSFQRKYCIGYDVVVTRAFLRNHALLSLCSVLGMYDVEYFTLTLLDVVNISPIIGDIIKSVTSPGRALFYVLYLFIISSVIYASFGMANFGDQMRVPVPEGDDDDATSVRRLHGAWEEEDTDADVWEDGYEESGLVGRLLRNKKSGGDTAGGQGDICANLFQCSLFMFYHGMTEEGNLKAFLEIAAPGTYNYLPRIIYDAVYFVWVGIVLVNIITALMVDTFSAIREEKAQRGELLQTECYVCGMVRSEYENLGLKPGSPSFAVHRDEEHDLWTYVYFIAYLKSKDPTEYNGIESYVRRQIDKQSLEWLPSRTSFGIQDQGKGVGSSDDVASQSTLDALDKKIEARLDAIMQSVAQISGQQSAGTAGQQEQQQQQPYNE